MFKKLQTVIVVVLIMLSGRIMGENNDLLIFSSIGNNMIIRGKSKITRIAGEKLEPGDILKVSKGAVTIINRNQKRVTISVEGNHTYATVKSEINDVEASLTTRYFIFVWEQMNKEIKKINSPGGVVRGERPELHPTDSAKVISDTVLFFIRNPLVAEYKITVKTTSHEMLRSYNITDSVLIVATSEIADTLPEEVYWEVSTPFQRPVRRLLYFPGHEEKEQLLAGFNQAYMEFNQQERVLRMALIYEYLKQNRLYLYPY